MAQVFLTSASSSPWLFPVYGVVAGHTVELVGCGGNGAVGTTGTSGVAGGGGGGGGYAKLTYSSGTITPGTTTIAFAVPAGGAGTNTIWQTATNGHRAGFGGNASGATAGTAGATGSVIGTPAITYTLTSNFAGAAGGAGGGVATLGGGGGGGSAGPTAAGGTGRTPTTTQGGGGGGANNGSTGNAASTTGGTGSTGTGGTVANPGGAGTGCSGGGGGTAVASSVGGLGGSFAGGGPGGGGGGSGAFATNTTTTLTGGNGGSYGGGGGGCGYARAPASTFVTGKGAGGVIIVTFTANPFGPLAVTDTADTAANTGYVAVTWSPSDKHAEISLSNSNLTASMPSGTSTDRVVRATTAYSSGKYYFEIHADTIIAGPSDYGLGICNSSQSLSLDIGSDNNGVFIYPTGSVYNVTKLANALVTYAQGDTLCLAVDLTAKSIWFRNGSGNWNASGTANPATGTGGITYTATGSLFPAFDLYVAGDVVTARFKAADFGQAVPSGFSAWDSTPIAGSTGTLVVTDTGDTAAVTGSNTATLAVTDAPDISAIVSAGNSGTLVVTEASDTAATTGVLVRWDANNKYSGVTLSSLEMTATLSSGEGLDDLVKATHGYSTGKKYFEVAVTVDGFGAAAASTGIGIALSSVANDTFLGGDTNSIGVFTHGKVYYNGVQQGSTIETYTAGDRLCVAVDCDAKKIWFRKNGGSWDNTTDDPAAGTGGYTYTASGLVYPTVELSHAADSVDGKFAAAEFARTVPSGFTAWNPATAGLTGTLGVTDTGDTAAVTGSDTARLAATDAPDVSLITVSAQFGTLAVTDTGDTAAVTGSNSARLAVTDAPDISLVTVSAQFGTLGATDAIDTAAVTGSNSARLAATDALDVSLITVSAQFGTLAYVENPDNAAIVSPNSAVLAVTEAADISAIIGANLGTLAVTDTPDACLANGTVTAIGTLGVTDTGDTCNVTVSAQFGTLGYVENPDNAAFASVNSAYVAATDAKDTSLIQGANNAILAVTEALDTSLLTGNVAYLGTLGVTDAPDVSLITSPNSAILGVTDTKDVSLVNGTVAYTGTLGVTDTPDTAAFTGSDSAVLAVTEAPDVSLITGNVAYLGTLGATDAPDVALITGSNTALLAVTETADTPSFAGKAAMVGPLAVTEASDVASVTGAGSALVAATDAPDTANITGSDTALLAVTDAPDTCLVNGTVAYKGTLAVTDAPDVALLTGNVAYQGTLVVTEGTVDTALITGSVPYQGALAVTEGFTDTAALTGTVTYTGALAVTEAPDVAAIVQGITYTGTLTATDAPDISLVTGNVKYLGTLAVTEATDTASFTSPNSGIVVWFENPDNANITAVNVFGIGPLAVTEAKDTASFTDFYAPVTAVIGATEAPDISAIAAALPVTIAVAATETQDTFEALGFQTAIGTVVVTDAPDNCVLYETFMLGSLTAIEQSDFFLIQGTVTNHGKNWFTREIRLPQPIHVRVIMADPPQALMPIVDIPVERGNNLPIVWEFLNDDQTIFDLSDSDFVLTITFSGGKITKRTGTDPNLVKSTMLGTVTYTPSLSESRLLRPGRVNRYELERRQATVQRVVMAGDVIAAGGDNTD